jgi:hypothetical protein
MPYDEYTTDTGEALGFRMVHHGLWIPVLISREAMEAHFGASDQILIDVYRAKERDMEERVRSLLRAGVPYSRNHPLRVSTADL